MQDKEIRLIFKENGVVFTKQRAAVYAYLKKQALPLTAAQIADGLQRTLNKSENKTNQAPKAWLSTVYRSLELFLQKSLVSEFRLPQGEALAYFLNENQHRHYAVCTGCNAMLDLSKCPLSAIEKELLREGFRIHSHRLEIYGLCANCNNR